MYSNNPTQTSYNDRIIDWDAIFHTGIEFITDVPRVAMAPISSICFQSVICRTNNSCFRGIVKYVIPLEEEY